MFVHLFSFFFKHTMALLGIAFNNGGVQCVCISLFLNIRWRSQGLRLTAAACNVFASLFFKLKHTMAFLGMRLTAVACNVVASLFFETYDGVLRDCS